MVASRRYGEDLPTYVPAIRQLKRASHMSIEFPITSSEVMGSIRDHIHIYPHANGGAPEKLGRNLYTIRFEANFQATFKKYPGLWPLKLRELRGYWEDETTGPLVVPTIGTIQAYCRNWTQKMDARIASGETVSLEFQEDQDATKLEQELQRLSIASFSQAALKFNASKALADFQDDSTAESIFDAISDAANFILSFADLAELGGNLVSSKLLALADLQRQFSRTNFADDITNEPIMNVFYEFAATVQTIQEDINAQNRKIEIYIVPSTTSMLSLSQQFYGDGSHVDELMSMNAVEDQYEVPAATRIKFYPPEK